MIVTYNNHVIELVQKDKFYHVLIDGNETTIKSVYPGAARNQAVKAIQEQERKEKIMLLKEVGL